MRAVLLVVLLSAAVVCVSSSPFGGWGYGGFYGGYGGYGYGGGKWPSSFYSKKAPSFSYYQPAKKQPTLPPQPTKLPPIRRTQIIQQDVIQPIYETQPVLQVRHVTQNVYQPTLQKQPVIQPIITQPIIHRVIHNQPIIRQQLEQQTVVKRRVIHQPRIVQQVQTQLQTAPTLTKTTTGADYPTLTQPNPKLPQLTGAEAGAGARAGAGAADDDGGAGGVGPEADTADDSGDDSE